MANTLELQMKKRASRGSRKTHLRTEGRVVTSSTMISNAVTNRINIIHELYRRNALKPIEAKGLITLISKKNSNALLGFKREDLRRIVIGSRNLHLGRILLRPRGESSDSIIKTLGITDPSGIMVVKNFSDGFYEMKLSGQVSPCAIISTGFDDIIKAGELSSSKSSLVHWVERNAGKDIFDRLGGGDPPIPPNGFNLYLWKAMLLYGRFKAMKIDEIFINDESIFFNSRDPRLFRIVQYGPFEPAILLMCLYAIHYSMRSAWDIYRDSDKNKLSLLKSSILALKPQYEEFLNLLTDELDKITSEQLTDEKEELVTEFVKLTTPPEFELIKLKKSPFISPMLTNRDFQYRFYRCLNDEIIPGIREQKKWIWSMLRSAMAMVGMFADVNETTKGKAVISDGGFARCIFPFISDENKLAYALNYDNIRVDVGRKESTDINAVNELAKCLREYELGIFAGKRLSGTYYIK